MLLPLLLRSWGADTCDPSALADWHPGNPSRGQSAPTALVVREVLGGDLVHGRVTAGGEPAGDHWWNLLPDGTVLDLTRDQFRPGELVTGAALAPPGPLRRGRGQHALLRHRVLTALGRSPLPAPSGLPIPSPRDSAGLPTPSPRDSAGLPTPSPRDSAGLPTPSPRDSAGLPTPSPRDSAGLRTPSPGDSAGLPASSPGGPAARSVPLLGEPAGRPAAAPGDRFPAIPSPRRPSDPGTDPGRDPRGGPASAAPGLVTARGLPAMGPFVVALPDAVESPPLRLTLALLVDPAGAVLLRRRSPTAPFEPGQWALPAVAMRPDEDPDAAARRALAEEAGIDFADRLHPHWRGTLPDVTGAAPRVEVTILAGRHDLDDAGIVADDLAATDLAPTAAVALQALIRSSRASPVRAETAARRTTA